jgi:arabinofuranosyltransferase
MPSLVNDFIRRPASPLIFVLLMGVIAYIGIMHFKYNSEYGLDDSYITYRYAYNFAEGYGLVFNPGEKHYGSTAAGYAILVGSISKAIAFAGTFLGIDEPNNWDLRYLIPIVSRAISTFSLMVGALILVIISRDTLGNIAGSLAGGFTVLMLFFSSPSSSVVGHETYLFLVLWLFSSYLAIFLSRYLSSAVVVALATTVRPDSILFAGILFIAIGLISFKKIGLLNTIKQTMWPAFLYISIVTAWLLLMWLYYGQPFPETRIAKQAQVVLGHWALFSPNKIFNYLSDNLRVSILVLMIIFLLASMVNFLYLVAKRHNKLDIKLNYNLNLLAFSGIWFIVAIGLVFAYTILNVTYWEWYAVPIWFAIICMLPGLFSPVFANLRSSSLLINGLGLVGLASVVATFIIFDRGHFLWLFNKMQVDQHVNGHIGSYNGVIEILHLEHPQGTSIATAEPGHLGFALGPNFQVVDTLGLTSPGVARAILVGDMDYPFKTWEPQFFVSSWKGKFDPTQRAWFKETYRLHSELTDPYWTNALKGPYQFYEKIN